MRARIVGGALAWAVSLAPLVVVNLVAYLGVFTLDEAAVIGALALVAGVGLGALTAGLAGGRAPDLSVDDAESGGRMATPAQRATASARGALAPRVGARGALATGGVAATLYALTMGGLILVANAFNILPNLVTLHPIRISAAILCVAAVFLGLAMLVGWLAARGATADDWDVAPPGADGRMSARPGMQMGGGVTTTPAQRALVAATRPLMANPPARGAAARATRPLYASEYGGPDAYHPQDGYGEPGAYGSYARAPQAPSRPRSPTPAPTSPTRDPYDQRDPIGPVAPLDDGHRRDGYASDGAYRRRSADERDRFDDDGYGDEDPGGYDGRPGDRRPRYDRPPADRRSRRRNADGGYDADDADDADDWRRGDDRRRDSRAGARRPAHRDDRYER